MSETRVAVLGAMLTAIGPFAMYVYLPAVGEIAAGLAVSDSSVKLTISAYFVGFAVSQLLVGPISDALGRKPVLYALIGCFCLASLVASVATTIDVLLACRVVQGIGAAAGMAISRALVRDVFSGERSARIMNVMGIVLAAAPAVAPVAGGVITTYLDWRATFVSMTLFGLAVILVMALFAQETVTRDWTRFSARETIAAYRHVLSDRLYVFSTVALAAPIGAVYANYVFLPFVMIEVLGLTPIEFGIAGLLHPGGLFVGSLLGRWMMPSLGAPRLAAYGYVAVVIAALVLASMLIWPPSFWQVMIPVALLSFGIAFVMPHMTAAALEPFPRNAGAASSMMGFLQIGFGLVMGSLGAAFADPVAALATILPAMMFVGLVGFLAYRRLA